MPLDKQIVDRLFNMNEAMKRAGFSQEMSDQEIRRVYQKMSQPQGQGSPMAPMPSTNRLGGGQIQSQIPLAGFQGNTMFNNQAGVGQFNGPMGGQSRSMNMQPGLNTTGQPVQGMNTPGMGQPPQQMAQGGIPGMGGMMGGGMPGGRGFTTNIQIGADGQLESLTLKKALQKVKGQAQGGMA